MFLLTLTVLTVFDFKNGGFFREIYNEYKGKVYRGAFSILKNHHDAEEALQDVFFKVYKNIEIFRKLPREEIVPLIVIYTKNTAIDYLRKKKRNVHTSPLSYDDDGTRKEYDIADFAFAPDRIVIDRERAEQVGAYIDSLSEKQRHVILMRYKYGMSEKEIAKIMFMTETAVSSCINRAKKTLRERMEGNFDD